MPSNRRASLQWLISTGAAAVCGVMVACLAAVAGVSGHGWNALQAQTERAMAEQNKAAHIVRQAQNEVLLASYFMRDPRPGFMRDFRAAGDDVFDSLRSYLFRDLSAGERAQVEEIKQLHQELEATAQLVFDLVQRGAPEQARWQTDRLVALSQRLERDMEQLMETRSQRLVELHAMQEAVLRRMYAATAVLSLVLLLLIGVLTRAVRVRLLRPLNALSRTAALLGSGNLGARAPVARDDELGAVAETFNRMADRLQLAREELVARNQELSQAFATLRETQQEVVQSEKLTALGGMLAGLAHELNNPLASILGCAELLHQRAQEQLPGGALPWLGEMTEPILAEALRASGLVRNLLLFSRSASPVLGRVDLPAALQVAVNLRRYAFLQANLELRSEIPAGLRVVGEVQRLQQVFLNLINNSFDALSEGGGSALTLRAAISDDGEWVEVEAVDDGPGMASPERVFDPFYTTKPVGKGTGLGLSLVHRMVNEFGGSIEARNGEAGGACFLLRLRVAPAEVVPGVGGSPAADPLPAEGGAKTATPGGGADAMAPGQRPRVLVVDDEEPIRNVQRRLLMRMQVDVHSASSGAEAMRMLDETWFDAVISDVKMPGAVDGLELYHWVCRTHPRLADRFVFITGDVYGPAASLMADIPPDSFLAKPFRADEYSSQVTRVLARGEADRRGTAAASPERPEATRTTEPTAGRTLPVQFPVPRESAVIRLTH